MSKTHKAMFRSLYVSLVRKSDDVDDPIFKEQLDLLTTLIRNELSVEEVKLLLQERVVRDNRNSDLWLSPKDRSALNRKSYEEHINIRSLTIKTFIVMTTILASLVATFFCFDLYISYTRDHDTIIKFINFLKILIE